MVVAAACLTAASRPAHAQILELGDLAIGGAIRVNAYGKSWEDDGFPLNDAEIDTIRLEADLTGDGPFLFSGEYRYYPYRNQRDTHFPHHLYAGYRFGEDARITAGIQQVPFGVTPFASNSYFFTIAYYVGLEDDYDLGVKYEDGAGPWSWAAAYYIADEGDYFGASQDSARYSYDVVASADSANGEEDQFNLRLARSVDVFGWDAEIGASVQYGRIPNAITRRSGDHVAAAAHLAATRGPWGLKAETIWYDYQLEQPPGADSDIVVMGAYDFPYDVAARGMIHSLAVSYRWDVNAGWLESVTLYNDYSILTKEASGFADTHHNVLGASLDFAGPLFVYVDLALGKHNAWIGPDFGDALAGGGASDGWHSRLNVNLGLYF